MAHDRSSGHESKQGDYKMGQQPNQHRCGSCDSTYDSYEALREHQKYCMGDRSADQKMDRDDPGHQQLNRDLMNAQETQPTDDLGDEQLGHFKCGYCDSTFSMKDDLRQHEKHCSARNRAGGRCAL